MNDKTLQKKIRRKFTITELSGAFGDWGTLIPFVIGYISVVGLSPGSIFLCLGITNIILGVRYNLPLPVQPQKTISSIALAQKWNPNLVISTGFGTGIVWTILGFSKKLNNIVQKVPKITVKGIQLGLSLILGLSALLYISDNIVLGIISLAIILAFIKFKKIPTALILTGFGIFLLFLYNKISLSDLLFSVPSLQFHIPNIIDLLKGMILAGIAQLFLTLTNVMIATISLMRDLFPDKSNIDANNLAINMGAMNLMIPFIGGFPLCHGSGGVAAQYAFGARTGGSMIFEGIIEIILGLFFSNMIFSFFSQFPISIFGAMLLYVSFVLAKVSLEDFNKKTFWIIVISAIFCFILNIFIGFMIGLILFLIYRKLSKKWD
jgi:predicted benzoate:H+ symporter BenE